MGATYFHNFEIDTGKKVTVEYSATGGESNFDHPGHICDGGGSGPQIVVLDAFPNDDAYEDLCKRRSARTWKKKKPTRWDHVAAEALRLRMVWACWRRATLSALERERIEDFLAEHHVEEDPEPEVD